MKVKELIKLLEAEDQEAVIITEGCDCEGDVGSIESRVDKNEVVLCREEDKPYWKKYK